MIILTLGLLAGCQSHDGDATQMAKQNAAFHPLATLLPEDTRACVMVSSVESLFTAMSVTPASIFGVPVDTTDARDLIGLNPLDREALRAAGIDTHKPVALALTDVAINSAQRRMPEETPQVTAVLLLPATDANKAAAALTRVFENEESGFTVTPDGNLTLMTNADAQVQAALAVKDDYVALAGSSVHDGGFPAKSTMLAMLAGETALAESMAYAEITATLHASGDLLAYVDLASLLRDNADAMRSALRRNGDLNQALFSGAGMAQLDDLRAFGASVNLHEPDLHIRSVLTLTEKARTKALWEGVRIDKTAALSIPEPPALFMSWAVNVAEYYRLLSDIAAEPNAAPFENPLDGPLGAFEALTGIAVDTDVLPYLGGNGNFGIYDGSTITMANYNALLSLTVTDETAMQQVLDTAIAALPPQQRAMMTTQTVDGVEAHVLMAGLTQAFLGIHANQIILATGKPMFQKALTGNVDDGFSRHMDSAEVADTLNDTGNIFYLNVDEIVKAARNFEMFLQGLAGGPAVMRDLYVTAGKFEYLLASSRLQDSAILSDFSIQTRFSDPFLVEIAQLLQTRSKPQ